MRRLITEALKRQLKLFNENMDDSIDKSRAYDSTFEWLNAQNSPVHHTVASSQLQGQLGDNDDNDAKDEHPLSSSLDDGVMLTGVTHMKADDRDMNTVLASTRDSTVSMMSTPDQIKQRMLLQLLINSFR